MFSRSCIAMVCFSIAIGMLMANLAPGTVQDAFFLQCLGGCPKGSIFPVLLHSPWFWIPSLLIAVWPFDIVIPGLKLKLVKTAQFKIAVWVLLFVIAFPWFSIWINPIGQVINAIAQNQVPIFNHGDNFCSVCDYTLWETLISVLLPMVHCILWFFGVSAGVRNFLRTHNFGMYRTSDKRNLFAISCGYFISALILSEIIVRFCWAESSIHQGFH
jgi:hypothetical protein